ncbi:MAG: pyridoxal phosphate-dependent aminotransferase [Candidatus Cyclonatronum sp.]|uniref:pyridoxal phosphate-dependent aminotransferase n=1 Tax=Cyclonatronum sp. TaxID=3024185 RepID=UPI0025B80596|nr:pyridoxal phosphate-dependent aminotransferase [Cyclonatronum sp.]MCH8485269.1 pyridoxal phosphate-dependent aminotransferase [Cyclonatronum sp.]
MISKRAQSLAPSETMKISGIAKEMQQAGKSVISLSQGEPDFKTPAHICEAAKRAIDEGHHGYTINAGTTGLREAIVEKLKRENNLEYTAAEVVVSNGAKQSVGFSLLAVVDEGDEVLIPAPYWVSYPEMTKLAGGVPVIVRTAFENDYKLTPEQLRSSLSKKTKVLILCSPSNPTGSCYTAGELEALAEVLRDFPNVVVLSDEIYEYIVFDGPHVSMLQVAPWLKDRFIVVNGFSKGFAMTGWRLGYIAAPKSIAGALGKIQSQETSAPSTISQIAGEAGYRSPLSAPAIEEMRKAFAERRDYFIAELNKIDGVKCFKPGGAFYAFPNISAYLGKTAPDGSSISSSTDLCMYLIEHHGLAIVPGDAFGEPEGVRLSYSASMETLAEGLKRFRAGLAALS